MRVGLHIAAGPLNGNVCNVHSHKVPLVQSGTQQRIDAISPTANVQSYNMPQPMNKMLSVHMFLFRCFC